MGKILMHQPPSRLQGGNMKIAATTVSMEAARTYREVEQRTTRSNLAEGMDELASVSDFGLRLSRSLASTGQTQTSSQSVTSRSSGLAGPPLENQSHMALVARDVLAQMTGRVLGQPVSIGAVQENGFTGLSERQPAGGGSQAFAVRRVEVVSGTVYSEEETTLFSAAGQVTTAEGLHIFFQLGISMERKRVILERTSMAVPLFIDPLVLRFDTSTPLLGDSTFLFDLDGDGLEEELACPGKGSGFLAFDRNRDGVINNGLELFGPSTGSGFGELSLLDDDANLWIDENDPLFAHLYIWKPGNDRKESLLTLVEAGVGAISVIHAGSRFQLEGAEGRVLGSVKASGIFLSVDGAVLPLQEVDLALLTREEDALAADRQQWLGRLDSAMQLLRSIVHRQQLRLRLMLVGRRLSGDRSGFEKWPPWQHQPPLFPEGK